MAGAVNPLAAQSALIKKAGLNTPNIGVPQSSTFDPMTGQINQAPLNSGFNTSAPVLNPAMPSVPTPTAYQAPDDAGQFSAQMLANSAANGQAQDQQNIVGANLARQQAKMEAQTAQGEQDAWATAQSAMPGSVYNPNTGGVMGASGHAAGGGYSAAQWGGNASLSSARNAALKTAFSYVGDPYVLGGTSHQGIDCSGLVMAVYDQFGYGKYLNSHNARIQGQSIPGYRTSVSNLVPGDIVAWNDGSHIAIYAGNGMIVAAAAPGEGVKYQPVWGSVTGIHIRLPGE